MDETKEPVSAPLRRLTASLLTLGRIRLELFAIEVQEEKDRIAGVLMWSMLAGLMAGFGLLMLLMLFVVAMWDTNRLLALGVSTGVLVFGAVLAAMKVKAFIAQPSTLFSASIGELRQDADALKREVAP
ncbi:phage holin family protein [Roseateles sp. DC23W]|uniref:Phage holin family protein n=1 Tax=Pelomonas dachongensis TaxID=3299029 RepID=A0ABW7EM63_9BURK